jgi:hypothetical protein
MFTATVHADAPEMLRHLIRSAFPERACLDGVLPYPVSCPPEPAVGLRIQLGDCSGSVDIAGEAAYRCIGWGNLLCDMYWIFSETHATGTISQEVPAVAR